MEVGRSMYVKRLVFTFVALFMCGCFFEVSDQAVVLIEDPSLFDEKRKLTRSIGLEISDGLFHPILPSGTRTPSADAIVFEPKDAKDEAIKLSFYRGLSQSVAENHLIGTYSISGILRGTAKPRVQLVIAAKGDRILAEATELSTSKILTLERLEDSVLKNSKSE